MLSAPGHFETYLAEGISNKEDLLLTSEVAYVILEV